MQSDDSYAGSTTFYRLEKAIQEVFGMKFFLRAHQGRACENITKCFSPTGSTVLMDHHFTTARAHVLDKGGKVEEFLLLEGFNPSGNNPFGKYGIIAFSSATLCVYNVITVICCGQSSLVV
jgi:tryptophanase